jgi:RNA polymerase sigma-70 factor (ECF subfamily)
VKLLAARVRNGKIHVSELLDLRDQFSPDATRALFHGGGSAVPLRDIDRQLIDRCLAKEPGAWNDFVDRYMGLIYHVIHHVAHARSLVISNADIEDIAAEIFLGIVDDDYAVLRRFRGASSLPTYLTVVARRICVKEVIKRHREAELGHLSAHRAIIEDDTAGRAEAIASAEEVEQMLENLPEREAEVVRLYHLKYLNYRQISKQLGIAENSVGPILARARQRLRRAAEQRGSAEQRSAI